MPAGRPSKYKPIFAEQVTTLCRLGLTSEELGQVFGVEQSTVRKWCAKNPEFRDAVKAGRVVSDANVAESLYQQAMNGNVTACIFWLKNRRTADWHDRHEIVARVEHETVREVQMQDGEAVTPASAGLPEAGIN